MNKGHITERADAFAKRLRPNAPALREVDSRTPIERQIAFHQEYESQRVKEARDRARNARP